MRNWKATNNHERVSNLQTREAALKAADHLAEALEENTKAMAESTSAMAALEDRVTRRTRFVVVVLVAVVLTMGLVVKFNYDGNVRRCESGNELREEIDSRFQSVADSLIEAGVGGTPEEDALLIILSADLDPRDCSGINFLGQ